MFTLPKGDFAIFDESKGADLLFQGSRPSPKPYVTGYWKPEVKEIEELEEKLLEFPEIKSSNSKYVQKFTTENDRPPAGAYRRQYVGIIMNTKKLIYANFLPRDNSHEDINQVLMVFDGGASYWGIVYDPETKSFSDIEFNGES